MVTKPFSFEGVKRARAAEAGISELQQYVDTLIIIPNQNLFRIANEHTGWKEAFQMADNVLYMGVRGVTDLMVVPGLVNLDFADIRTVMSEMGKAMMGTGEAEGDNRSVRAAEAAISNPLLEDTNMAGARGLLINITGGEDMTLFEVDQAANRIREEVDEEANIIFGSAIDSSLNGRIRVSVVATGIDSAPRSSIGRSSNSPRATSAWSCRCRPRPLRPSMAETMLQATGTGGAHAASAGFNPAFSPAAPQWTAGAGARLRRPSRPPSSTARRRCPTMTPATPTLRTPSTLPQRPAEPARAVRRARLPPGRGARLGARAVRRHQPVQPGDRRDRQAGATCGACPEACARASWLRRRRAPPVPVAADADGRAASGRSRALRCGRRRSMRWAAWRSRRSCAASSPDALFVMRRHARPRT